MGGILRLCTFISLSSWLVINWMIGYLIFLEEKNLLDIVITPYFIVSCHISLALEIFILDLSCEYVTLNTDVLRERRISYLT